MIAPFPVIAPFQCIVSQSPRRNSLGLLTTAWIPFVIACLLVGAPPPPTCAQSGDDDEEEPYRPGLVARHVDVHGTTLERLVTSVQFPLDETTAPPTTRPGSKDVDRVTWRGRLWIQVPGTYRLFAHGQGRATFTLQDKVVLKAESLAPEWHGTGELELPFGYLPLEVEYARGKPDAPAEQGQLSLFWTGPQFALEPIPPRFLLHPRESTPSLDVTAARRLTRALRCAACHDMADELALPAAPALDRVRDNLQPEWTVEYLTAKHFLGATRVPGKGANDGQHDRKPGDDANGTTSERVHDRTPTRRMPHFALSRAEAADITAFLFERSLPPALQVGTQPANSDLPKSREKSRQPDSTKPVSTNGASGKSKPSKVDTTPPAERGRRLFVSVGCLACHRHDGLGTSGLFDGGDLTHLTDKRPEGFVERWLAEPASINRHHRMPVMELIAAERGDLAKFLEASPDDPARSSASPSRPSTEPTRPSQTPDPESNDSEPGDPERGAELFESRRCQACHLSPDGSEVPRKVARAFGAKIDWEQSCLACGDEPPTPNTKRPTYSLSAAHTSLVRNYIEQVVAPALIRRSKSAANSSSPDRNRGGREGNAGAREGKSETPGAERTSSAVATFHADWLVENQCLNCHSRDDRGGLNDVAVVVAGKYVELAPSIHGLLPPSLTSVGDKLTDEALATAITRSTVRRRPWLAVRMPKYGFSESQLQAAVSHLVRADRIPADPPPQARAGRVLGESELKLDDAALRTVGGRLVTTDGFGCLSCHAVGAVVPPNAPLNQRAPDLSQLAVRIRPTWFDRWTRNPARIVPRMEMPSVQLAVRGVLDEHLDRQLAAVWHALNRTGFVPPEPNPVQTLRLSGVGNSAERTEMVTDVLQAEGRTWIKPLLLGLPNRNNVLFDLETNRLARWSLGDVARQRTKGKTWFWEAAGVDLLGAASRESELQLDWNGRRRAPLVAGQFPTELDGWRHIPGGLEFTHRLRFSADATDAPKAESRDGDPKAVTLRIRQRIVAIDANAIAANNGFRREIAVAGVPDGAKVALQVLDGEQLARAKFDQDRRRWRLDDGTRTIAIASPDSHVAADGMVLPAVQADSRTAEVQLEYRATLANDQFPPQTLPPLPKPSAQLLDVVPGFVATRLPLSDQQMPTALAWRANGTLVVASLKGRVWQARDTDGDGLEDHWQAASDELAAPYGVAVATINPRTDRGDTETKPVAAIDVTTKYAVLRLWDDDGDGRADRTQTIASGWGHTADYHDWTVGLPSDGQGGYFIGLACQQDKRSLPAAHLRGTMVHLVPRTPTDDDPRLFQLEPISAGHRFPMGIAVNRAGDIFVTDNQGNYNPFNELNHVRRGLRYGFINAWEQKPDFRPPTESPAIEIPHPWTRSVNGICFLDVNSRAKKPDATPQAVRPFGPFTGHLIGCEYDTRRLIRMSLQKIGATYQGVCYPFSTDEAPPESTDLSPTANFNTLLGPICCAVSPTGELYVGGIRDSGWGGGNNIGEVVRLRYDESRTPAGIAEVRVTRQGFEIDFTRPVDRKRAADATQYAISSYRRLSTPAYGGPDVDRRIDRISRIDVAEDARQVRVELEDLRLGFVYELRLQNLAQDGERFFPAEAHVTVRTTP